MKRVAIISLALAVGIGIPATLAAQDFGSAPSLRLSYFGDLITHPGVAVEFSLPFVSGPVGSAWASLKSGWYLHQRNHSGFFLGIGLGGGLTSPGGLRWEGDVNTGFFVSKPAGVVYVEDGLGGAVGEAGAARSNFMASASLGISWTPPLVKAWTPSPFLRMGGFGEYPFNGYFYVHPFVEAGLGFGVGQ